MRTKVMSVVAAVGVLVGGNLASAIQLDPASGPTNFRVTAIVYVRSQPGSNQGPKAMVTIKWTDNCSYESGFSIYHKNAGGQATLIKTVPANSTSASVFLPIGLNNTVPGSLGIQCNPLAGFAGFIDVDGK